MTKKEEKTEPSFREWCILELMGHRKLGGLVSEENRFGKVMCRIDVPKGKGFVTQYYGGDSIYACSPVGEEVAREFARAHADAHAPVHRFELPLLQSSDRNTVDAALFREDVE